MGDLEDDLAAHLVDARRTPVAAIVPFDQPPVIWNKFIVIDHGHVKEGTLAGLGDPGVACDHQPDPALNELAVELELRCSGPAPRIGKPLVRGRPNHAVRDLH